MTFFLKQPFLLGLATIPSKFCTFVTAKEVDQLGFSEL